MGPPSALQGDHCTAWVSAPRASWTLTLTVTLTVLLNLNLISTLTLILHQPSHAHGPSSTPHVDNVSSVASALLMALKQTLTQTKALS